jgi:hypothetical protein
MTGVEQDLEVWTQNPSRIGDLASVHTAGHTDVGQQQVDAGALGLITPESISVLSGNLRARG